MWTFEDEAREIFPLATAHCGDCRDYHLTRPYLNLGGVSRGPERDRTLFAPMLTRLVPNGARVLLAGAADTGLLRFVLSATGELAPRITVADQCETPLALCRLFANDAGVAIETRRADLIDATGLGPFEVIVGHLVLGYMPVDQRVAFLRNLAGMLTSAGTLIIAASIIDHVPRIHTPVGEQVLATLAARNIPLPGDGTILTEALHQFDTARQRGIQRLDGHPAALESLMAQAGLESAERHDLQSGRLKSPGPANRTYLVTRRKSGGEAEAAGPARTNR
jgi:hypothetical protein